MPSYNYPFQEKKQMQFPILFKNINKPQVMQTEKNIEACQLSRKLVNGRDLE